MTGYICDQSSWSVSFIETVLRGHTDGITGRSVPLTVTTSTTGLSPYVMFNTCRIASEPDQARPQFAYALWAEISYIASYNYTRTQAPLASGA